MKRSEMLQKIWNKLMSESHLNNTLMDKCIKMLQVVEQEGMLPPERKKWVSYAEDRKKAFKVEHSWTPEEADYDHE